MSFTKKVKQNPILRKILHPYIAFRRRLTMKVSELAENRYDCFLSRIESGNVVIRADDFLGCFEMGIHTSLLKRFFRFGEFEQSLTELVRKHIDPLKDVIDVGANIGLFTILFAKTIDKRRKVLAVEPTSNAMYYLKSNLKRNVVEDNVILFNGVLADRPGEFELHIIPGMEEYSSLGNLTHEGISGHSFETLIVNGETVDRLVTKYKVEPGFIKIDTEGAEKSVLSGSVKTLEMYRPVILSELSDSLLKEQGSSSSELMAILEKHGYKIFDAYTKKVVRPCSFEGEILALSGENEK